MGGIQYEQHAKGIGVSLDGDWVGEIRQDKNGKFVYWALGKFAGDAFDTMDEVKASIEGTESEQA